MSVLIPSETMFSNFINKNDIILDKDYDNLKNYYNYNFLDINKNDIYYSYFNLFQKYYYLKTDINLIYYIIIIYYFDKKNLLDFIRFFTAKLNFSNLNKKKILNFNKILNKSKIDLIKYLKENIDIDEKNFLLFIYCIQNYI
tara:strand:- start:11020 stop:11445 length:426 start_codon:yes stop_codon:yes gene_type:complete